MPLPDLPLSTLHRVTAQISHAASKGSRWIALPHPETGRPVKAWLKQDAALSLIAKVTGAMRDTPMPSWQRELSSEGPWEGLMFAAINAGLERGIFGRRHEDTGTMFSIPGVIGRKWAYWSFEHCNQTFHARVEAICDGGMLSLHVWLPAANAPDYVEPFHGAKLSDFAAYAHGWIERRHGFYLLGRGEARDQSFTAALPLEEALRNFVVTVPNFLVLKSEMAKASS
ncbi:MAG: hypothetical protein EOO15_02745 [Chitinophagaceae bacterium]|nr:MAG: hypothetical protein EOO15_02745 [Chitinophagaceae bacterium]